MMRHLPRRLRKSWHLMRRRLGAGVGRPRRLVVHPTKWLNDARSPVVLMIDDLTNAWHNRSGGETFEPGGDWGGGLNASGSALGFLETELLREHPDARVTFFTVAGPISAYTHHQPFSHAAPLDCTEESRRFFRAIAEDPRFELAYHGLNHGAAGKRTEDFIQEWRGFPSVEAAVAQTREGLAIFRRATGIEPTGGKYGGYDYNDFAETALTESGFLWWCRDWMPRDETGTVPDEYYEPQFFGPRLMVAIPSTVHGHFWGPRQIDVLLDRRQVISIAEHIAPIRPDGRTQTPNIVDDMAELRRLYAYLRGRDVWHATASQIAGYFEARERTIVYDVTADGFSLQFGGRGTQPVLSLRIDSSAICTRERPSIAVTLPDGTPLDSSACRFDVERYRHLITVPVMNGRYRVQPQVG